MSKTNHTSGPWIAERTGTRKTLIIKASGTPILRMYAGRNEDADARLIAAAPKLLDALRSLCICVRAMTVNPEARDTAPSLLIAAYVDAIQAIAETEGLS